MKKFILLLFVFVCTLGAVNAQTATLYLDLRDWPDWANGSPRIQVWVWGGDAGGGVWATFESAPVSGETLVFQATVPSGITNAIVLRRAPANDPNYDHSMDAWDGNFWDRIDNLGTAGASNAVRVTGWTSGTWTTFTPNVPSVSLSAPTWVFVNETITLTAISQNFANPVYVYSVKVPGSDDFVSTTSPHQPTATGTYIFAVSAAESNNPTEILATDTAEVIVRAVPEPITIKLSVASIPEDWENQIWIHAWEDGFTGGNWYEPTLDGEWYVYTFTRMESVSLIFVNGNSWTENRNQTVDIQNITESTCFEIGDLDFEGEWKMLVNVVECGTGVGIEQAKHQQVLIFTKNNTIYAHFEGRALVELFSITGQSVYSEVSENRFAHSTERGIYLLRINGQTYKVIVQ